MAFVHERRAEDARLVQAGRAGDPAAFGALFAYWFDPCVDVAWRILRDREAAADVAQDVFLGAWRNLDQLRDPGAFGGWALRSARNHALNRLARERRSTPAGAEAVTRALDADPPTDETAAVVGRDDDARLVWAASAALGERDVSLLDLHLRHGLAVPEIAEALGVTANNAHQLLFRLRKKLSGAIRAWVLWRDGTPACPILGGALVAAGVTRFGADAVRITSRHLPDCDDCDTRQQLRLAPEALFAAIPVLPATPALRARAASALQAQGVPVGPVSPPPGLSGDAKGDAEGPSGPDQPDEPAGAHEPGGPDEPAAAHEPGGPAGPAADGRGRSTGRSLRTRVLVVAGVAALVLSTAGYLVAGAGDGETLAAENEVASSAGPATTSPDEPPGPPTTSATTSPAGQDGSPTATPSDDPTSADSAAEDEEGAATVDTAADDRTGTDGDAGAGEDGPAVTPDGDTSDPGPDGDTDSPPDLGDPGPDPPGGDPDPDPPEDEEEPEPERAPEVLSFTSARVAGAAGCPSPQRTVVLSWQSEHAATATLTGPSAPQGPLPPSGSSTLCLSGRGQTYTLTATGPAGSTSATALA